MDTIEDDSIFQCWCGASGTYEQLFDDSGLDDTCGGLGSLHCHCGGDLCVCHHHGEVECPGCEDCDIDDSGDEDFDDSDPAPEEFEDDVEEEP